MPVSWLTREPKSFEVSAAAGRSIRRHETCGLSPIEARGLTMYQKRPEWTAARWPGAIGQERGHCNGARGAGAHSPPSHHVMKMPNLIDKRGG